MRNITAYEGSYANPGDALQFLTITRNANLDVVVSVRDTKWKQVQVTIPQSEWVRMLKESLAEFAEEHKSG